MCVCVRFAISSNSSLCAKAKTGDNNAEKSTQSCPNEEAHRACKRLGPRP